MERGIRRSVRYARGFWGGFWGTMLWLLPVMLLFGGAGYFLSRYLLAPHFLQPSKVQFARPQPIRVLSPEEAATEARDEPSPVWSRGVRDSDIPKMDNALYPPLKRHSSHTHRKTDDNAVQETTPAPDNSAPVDSPAIDTSPMDNGGTAPSPDQPPAATPSDAPSGDTGGTGDADTGAGGSGDSTPPGN